MTSYNLVHVQCMFKYVATLVMGVRLYNIEFHSWFVYTLIATLFSLSDSCFGMVWIDLIWSWMNESLMRLA